MTIDIPRLLFITGLVFISVAPALAHDPIFSMGPHVAYKGGIELALEAKTEDREKGQESQYELEAVYGVTENWTLGVEIPYIDKETENAANSGIGEPSVFTKYRFWRKGELGAQSSASILFGVNFDNSDEQETPALGNAALDTILDVAYRHEGRKWRQWVNLRSIHFGENDSGYRKGEQWNFDVVAGYRGDANQFRKPDIVWMIELNTEVKRKNEQLSTEQTNTGGNELFLSPGLFLTYRNIAIKAGIQVSIYSELNGNQQDSENRYKLTVEWHI